jgi:3-dehydroquinate dehydratase-1
MTASDNPVKPMLRAGVPIAGGRLPLVCVSLLATNRASLLAEARDLMMRGPDIIEWRADHFAQIEASADILSMAKELRTVLPEVPLIFTWRSEREGGKGVVSSQAQLVQLLVDVARTGAFDFVDIEMWLGQIDVVTISAATKRAGGQCILSFHDFESTPDDSSLATHFALAATLGGDVAKVAVMPRSPEDVLRLLAATQRAAADLPLPIISMSMGPLGVMTRVFGAQFGSVLTFAAGDEPSAPGQISIDDMKALLRIIVSKR